MASTSALAVGGQVLFHKPRRGMERIGLVTALGRCDMGAKCPHGADCITVLVNTKTGGVVSVNVTPSDVEVVA